jgi:SdrD B-like domain
MTYIRSKLALIFGLLLLMASAIPALALTPPSFRMSDAVGNIVTIDMSGTVAFGGTCTAATCSTSILAFPQAGQITWGGKIGAFTVSATVGTTKPATDPSYPELDVSLQRLVTGATGGTLTIQWTDNGFAPVGVMASTTSIGGIYSGTAGVSFQTYIDPSNTPFGTSVLLGNQGPFQSTAPNTTSYSGTSTGGGPAQAPFSMTEVLTLTMGPNALVSGNFDFFISPKCPSALGDFVWNDVNGNGIQDSGEPGINGVILKLYQGSVPSGSPSPPPSPDPPLRDMVYCRPAHLATTSLRVRAAAPTRWSSIPTSRLYPDSSPVPHCRGIRRRTVISIRP